MRERANDDGVFAAERLRAASAYFRNGSMERALATIESAGAEDLSPAAQSLRSDILARLGRGDESLAAAYEAFERRPDRPDYVLRVARLLLARHRTDDAVRILERACAIPNSVERILAGVMTLSLEPQTIYRLYEIAFGSTLHEPVRPPSPERAAEIERILRQHVAPWRGRRLRPDSLIVQRNAAGARPPLFWCFQSEVEFAQLAVALGPEQPVFGMRSGHLIIGYHPSDIHAFAALYASEMLELQTADAFVIGGNCQGGIVAYEAAGAMRRAGRVVSMLVLMEQLYFPPYDGPISFIFGRDSTFDPGRRMPDAQRFFRDLYGAATRVDYVPGAHGEYFSGENMAHLARSIDDCIRRGRVCDDPP